MPSIEKSVNAPTTLVSADIASLKAEGKAPTRSFTKWTAFAKAGLTPTLIKCQAYQPFHRVDRSCHTNLKFDSVTFRRHLESEHGGALQLQLRKTDSAKALALWEELEASGLEAYDFRCDNCDKQLRFQPVSILGCMKQHGGKTRRSYPGGNYNITLGLGRPDMEETDED